MKHAPSQVAEACFPFLSQDGQSVVRSTAGMNDKGFATRAGRPYVMAKPVTLPLQVGNAAATLAVFHAVVVQACFADGHHTGQGGTIEQILHRGFAHTFVVGMHSDRAPEVVVGGCQRVNTVELFEGGTDTQRPRDLCVGHRLTDRWQLVEQFWKVEMAVRISEHAVSK
ncbi:hypothetical protein D3C71_1499000 [compost metagenome]